ncbi:MFS transporter (plasmid) [Rhizobium leguminosarum]|uniref:cyclophilin-like fold protein n=1 Tax=Rhizobium TaxID=379 RepID=UPI0010319B3F|nr:MULTISPECIES: cyclophilin-like fold protein [Rhizobium]NKK54423.1 MFS transporter [Rhizobium leguminosarum bv. viciae]TBF26423.1 MFS transporter [Rhizobium leguminosarum]TBF69407.1 MFS transporter [Rhizobium leguminosarum]TBF87013.1 MFS transporter [Rhizobium leguminosarum]TBG96696.1 MFS transporter [Rhizobium leguminosarum]
MITRRRNILLGIGAAMIVPNAGLGQQPAQVNGNSSTAVRVRFTFGDSTMTATLNDSPSAGDFASMLPLDLTIEDYSHNEKIVRLPRKLTDEGSGPFDNERPGDLCYFKPWGNLALFYGGYKWDGLIRLGRFEDGFDPLRIRGNFSVRIERA